MQNGAELWTCCSLVVAAGIVWGIWMARGPKRAAARLGAEVARTDLTDAQVLEARESRYDRLISGHYGSPETIAEGGRQRMAAGDLAAALFFYQKAIDLLQTLYISSGMRQREPSERDTEITNAYVGALSRLRTRYPAAPVAPSVREVTHRLRTISSACRSRGLPPHRYLSTLDDIGRLAPDVNVDDVFW